VVGGLILRGMGCRVIGNAKTTELFVGPINGPKRFGFNEFSSDFAGQIAGTKKPAGLAPCGFSGLHRMTLVITDGEFCWRSLNNSRKYLNLNCFNVFNFHLCT
ncbi:hypothetical protein ACMAWD_24975, partial [Klebsiella pneumoniae]|uniref:hypothetical protein n=1 Tax=Klebsiella pneumoniae TaxID=573 RepID=UPI0039B3DC49